ncbi:LLM class flavin-dependent oxidoreductase [Cohnella lubricantis]|uniref:LLM class flavin-dependent oxidoreductase n=1 Tax=Cohnella lubricantis TaxID=2163172 RepID=A0A841TK23_9BACL|nr:LLM class flavin-dependent oxidoreductase [Cohnella lubricantis]MBB6679287.1 LLM class flavin-dependent oxidoreductase [Cohnella lubricantis]MBP2120404.1 luciferase family oxidoreductase group 1 [Cohnella lubricantis]
MKLSILDQAPLSSGRTARDALEEAVRLAQAGEKFGYSRYWMAEHHDLPGLACSAPEIMLSLIGGQTRSIRLGAGAILLPYYRPYKVAETFNLLSTLFPGRIDLGIARSPGGSAEVSIALADRFLENVWKLPEAFEELLRFLDGNYPEDHPYARIAAAPIPSAPPEPWILGTSVKSAKLAAEQGVPYAFGHFMNTEHAEEAIRVYREQFRPLRSLQQPYVMLAVSAVCAETTEQARAVALSSYAWRRQLAQGSAPAQGLPSIAEAERMLQGEDQADLLRRMQTSAAIGQPGEVGARLKAWSRTYEADELLIMSYAHDFEHRLRSYDLIARELIAEGQEAAFS